MTRSEALAVLGLAEGAAADEIRTAYRRLVRETHPDVVGASGTTHTARLNAAWAVLRVVDHVSAPTPPPTTTPTGRRPAPGGEVHAHPAADDEATIEVGLPPDLTWERLADAARRVGELSYQDRHVGILEMIVRFDGGPSCSVVMTVQGRATHSDVFVTMESIEATPAPAIGPVITALVEAFEARR